MDENDKIIRDNLLGYLSYSVLDEDDTTAYIKMIEIKKTERRKGIGTKLINSLEKEYKNINWGYTTEEGTKFYQSYLKSTNGKWAVEYLSDRGLSNETIENFQLGCAPKDWNLI